MQRTDEEGQCRCACRHRRQTELPTKSANRRCPMLYAWRDAGAKLFCNSPLLIVTSCISPSQDCPTSHGNAGRPRSFCNIVVVTHQSRSSTASQNVIRFLPPIVPSPIIPTHPPPPDPAIHISPSYRPRCSAAPCRSPVSQRSLIKATTPPWGGHRNGAAHSPPLPSPAAVTVKQASPANRHNGVVAHVVRRSVVVR